ncbi:MAG TPA: hypothetical protein VE175_10370, partial [Woeseiaceae bacterium]|nr:hypothetical protein [Woeseiaceae bacterium]
SALPAEARKRFEELKRMMRSVAPLNGEGPIRATVRKMSAADAARCGGLMLDLLTVLIRCSATDRIPAAPRIERERPAVPPFLVKSG